MESVRRTVALATVLTGTASDDNTDHRNADHRNADVRDTGTPDVRHRAAAALDALGITFTATGPLTPNPQHRPMDAAVRQRVDEGRWPGDERAQHGPRNPQHGLWNPQHGPRNPQHGGSGVGTLVVANHVSWLDIPVLLALEPVTFLAKREVARWPFVGRQARRMGTLLLDRWSLRGLPATVDAVAERLRAGETVAVFPEATTWCSSPGGPFRRAVFQAAIDVGAPVRPVTLSYRQRGAPSTVAAFVGDDGLAASLARVVRARDLSVHVDVGRHLEPVGDRRTLARRAQHAVQGGSTTRTTCAADTVHHTDTDTHADTEARTGAAHV
ncbi:lysophospholipid acyltransferase family protein [Prauserella halophila]|uniref:lysophospholipid acyltransferase family protein n=1 Tax=Prauserella halophila TaxID=185641 RepID=UPI0035562E9E